MAWVVLALVDDPWPYKFCWKNNPERAKYFGKRCRIVTQGQKMRSVLVEFEDGERMIVSQRAIRRAD